MAKFVFNDLHKGLPQMRKCSAAAVVIVAVLVGTSRGYSQNWSFGGDMGLSSLDGSAGFHLMPMAEFLFTRNMGVGSEFSINTQYGTPMLWYSYFKYYFAIRGSGLRPYAHAGPVLALNVPNGPCFGILFGGGVNIPVARRLYLAPDILLGPVFGVGGGTYNLFMYGNYYGIGAYGATSYTVPGVTVFVVSLRGGIRYEI